MKIAIIGGHIGLGLALAQELAKRQVDVEFIAPDAELDELANLHEMDAIFREQLEPAVLPIIPRAEIMPDWPETIKPHRSRYNRKPKWAQNGSGSKFF